MHSALNLMIHAELIHIEINQINDCSEAMLYSNVGNANCLYKVYVVLIHTKSLID